MKWQVAQNESGLRLVAFLKLKINYEASLKQIKRWLELNFCSVNGQVERFASKKVKVGDRITFCIKEVEKPVIETLYEDNHYRIINKPAGLISEDIQDLLVHRLDKDTSGVMVLPKTEEACIALEEQFRAREVYKHYLTYVDGVPSKKEGVIKSRMEGDLLAVTNWRVKEAHKDFSLISCFPKTGRTHQIRIHMKDLGHPVLGDYHYCRKFHSSKRPQRQLLHSYEIRFHHLFKDDLITIRAEPPKDFSL